MQVRFDDYKTRLRTIPLPRINEHAGRMLGLSYSAFMGKINGHRPWTKKEEERLQVIIPLLENAALQNPVAEKANSIY